MATGPAALSIVRVRARTALLAAVTAWTVYAATTGGSFATDLASYEVTKSLFESGSVAMSGNILGTEAERGRDGRYYAPVGIGHPLFGLPFYAVASVAVKAGVNVGKPDSLTKAAVVFGSTVAAALCVGFGWLLAYRIGGDAGAASAAALVLAFATPLWVYAGFGFNAPLAAACLTASACGLWTGTRANSFRALTWGGIALAYAVITRHEMLLGAIPSALWLALESRGDARLLARRLIRFGVPVMAGVAVWVVYNVVRFGHPLDTGLWRDDNVRLSTPLLTGLHGLLFSPGRALFLYAPATVVGIFALVRLWRLDRNMAAFLAAYPIVFVLFIARMHHWDGGESYGPRYLVPIMPFLVLPIALWFRADANRRMRRFALVVIAGSVGIQVPGVLEDFSKTQLAYARSRPGYSIVLSRSTWEASPLVLNAQAAWRAIPENVRYVSGRPLPSIERTSDGANRDFSQQFAFSLDVWWLYLFYLGVLPAGVAVAVPLAFLFTATLLARQLWRAGRPATSASSVAIRSARRRHE